MDAAVFALVFEIFMLTVPVMTAGRGGFRMRAIALTDLGYRMRCATNLQIVFT